MVHGLSHCLASLPASSAARRTILPLVLSSDATRTKKLPAKPNHTRPQYLAPKFGRANTSFFFAFRGSYSPGELSCCILLAFTRAKAYNYNVQLVRTRATLIPTSSELPGRGIGFSPEPSPLSKHLCDSLQLRTTQWPTDTRNVTSRTTFSLRLLRK